MCEVIAVWDEHTGVMASEGRQLRVTPVATGDIMEPISDKYFKVHRLANGLILGATGDCYVLDELRAAITADARTFPEMCYDVIPRHVNTIWHKYPGASFDLLLMGLWNGRVRCAHWTCAAEDPRIPAIPVARRITTMAIGFAPVEKVTTAVWDALINRRNKLPSEQETQAALTQIFDDLARQHPKELNNRVRFESLQARDTKAINAGQVQPNLFEEPGDTEAVLFEATNRLTGFDGNQIWIGAIGQTNKWGGCNVWVSLDDTTYQVMGVIETPARLGALHSTFASGSDPDTSNSLVVDLAENSRALESGTTTDADKATTLCYVDGEIIAHSAAAVSGQNQYTLDTYIRRAQMGTSASSHSAGGLFMRLDDAVFKFTYDPTYAGLTLYFKFQSFNLFGNATQDLSTLTAVTFTVPGANPGTVDAETGLVAVKGLRAAHTSYRPLSNPLTATDAGTTATINIASFSMRVPGLADISLNSGSITGLSFSTLYYIYYDDPLYEGGAATYHATGTKEDGLNNTGRFLVGSILTPIDGGIDTKGNNDGGAVSGRITQLWMSATQTASLTGNGAINNPDRIIDGFTNTAATLVVTGNSGNNTAFISVYAPAGISRGYKSLKLRVLRAVTNTLVGGFSGYALFYKTNGLSGASTSIENKFPGAGGLSLGIAEVDLPLDTNISQLVIVADASANSSATSGSMTVSIYGAWVEVEE